MGLAALSLLFSYGYSPATLPPGPRGVAWGQSSPIAGGAQSNGRLSQASDRAGTRDAGDAIVASATDSSAVSPGAPLPVGWVAGAGDRQTPEPARTGVSETEAWESVEALLHALDEDDFERAASLTRGSAREQVSALGAEVARVTSSSGLAADLALWRVSLPGTEARGERRLVRATFDFAALTEMGGLRLPLLFARCSALFVVEQIDGQPAVTDILSVDGLPWMVYVGRHPA